MHFSGATSNCQVKIIPTLFEIGGLVATSLWQQGAPVVVETTQDDATGVSGITLFGGLLNYLALVEVAYRRTVP